jgi:hypothetical protein
MNRFAIYILLCVPALFAIEGHDPTPRFIPPDFSVEEDRITTPGDLIDFFSQPFVEYLRMTTNSRKINPFLDASSESEALGGIDFQYVNFFGRFRGRQFYFGDDNPRQMLRWVDFRAGYADILLDKIPVGVITEADYGYFRGVYEPSQYTFKAIGEAHIPLANFLASPYAQTERNSWNQRPGLLIRNQPYDPHRQIITNAYGGGLILKATISEYTGFRAEASAKRSTRYREGVWERQNQIISALGTMVFDSEPLRIEVGGEGHKTWEETIIAPHLDFHLTGQSFYIRAILGSEANLPTRTAWKLSPRVDYPTNARNIITPTLVDILGRLELKPDQFLMGHLDYRTIRGRPVLLSPLDEAPQVQCLDISHQAFTIRLLNDFGTFSNSLSLTLKSDEHKGIQIPTEPLQIVADTFVVELGSGFSIQASGVRQHLPQIAPKVINDIGIGARYNYDKYQFLLGISNILRNDIWDENALMLSREIRFWGGISVDL